LWTAIVLFGFVAIYAARLVSGHDLSFIGDLPRNTLIVTGSSIFTMAAAKAITTGPNLRAGKFADTYRRVGASSSTP